MRFKNVILYDTHPERHYLDNPFIVAECVPRNYPLVQKDIDKQIIRICEERAKAFRRTIDTIQ